MVGSLKLKVRSSPSISAPLNSIAPVAVSSSVESDVVVEMVGASFTFITIPDLIMSGTFNPPITILLTFNSGPSALVKVARTISASIELFSENAPIAAVSGSLSTFKTTAQPEAEMPVASVRPAGSVILRS